jgi:hypothetical protein
MRPIEYKGLLIGMATAFAKMHAVIVRFRFPLLSAHGHDALQKLAQRELEGLELCWKGLKADEKCMPRVIRGTSLLDMRSRSVFIVECLTECWQQGSNSNIIHHHPLLEV